MDEDDQQRQYYLWCEINLVSTIVSFLSSLWCWHYMNEYNQQMCYYQRSAFAVLLTIGIAVTAFWGLYYVNDEVKRQFCF